MMKKRVQPKFWFWMSISRLIWVFSWIFPSLSFLPCEKISVINRRARVIHSKVQITFESNYLKVPLNSRMSHTKQKQIKRRNEKTWTRMWNAFRSLECEWECVWVKSSPKWAAFEWIFISFLLIIIVYCWIV